MSYGDVKFVPPVPLKAHVVQTYLQMNMIRNLLGALVLCLVKRLFTDDD